MVHIHQRVPATAIRLVEQHCFKQNVSYGTSSSFANVVEKYLLRLNRCIRCFAFLGCFVPEHVLWLPDRDGSKQDQGNQVGWPVRAAHHAAFFFAGHRFFGINVSHTELQLRSESSFGTGQSYFAFTCDITPPHLLHHDQSLITQPPLLLLPHTHPPTATSQSHCCQHL